MGSRKRRMTFCSTSRSSPVDCSSMTRLWRSTPDWTQFDQTQLELLEQWGRRESGRIGMRRGAGPHGSVGRGSPRAGANRSRSPAVSGNFQLVANPFGPLQRECRVATRNHRRWQVGSIPGSCRWRRGRDDGVVAIRWNLRLLSLFAT